MVAGGEGGGGGGNRGRGLRVAYDEHRVRSRIAESALGPPETSGTLHVNYTEVKLKSHY